MISLESTAFHLAKKGVLKTALPTHHARQDKGAQAGVNAALSREKPVLDTWPPEKAAEQFAAVLDSQFLIHMRAVRFHRIFADDQSRCNLPVALAVQEEFTHLAPIFHPLEITAGPDGALWFTSHDSNQIGRMTPAGQVTEFPLPLPNTDSAGITAGPDGNLWFTDEGYDQLGRITPDGRITEFPLPTGSEPAGITAGPDGTLWFAEARANKLGRISPARLRARNPGEYSDTP